MSETKKEVSVSVKQSDGSLGEAVEGRDDPGKPLARRHDKESDGKSLTPDVPPDVQATPPLSSSLSSPSTSSSSSSSSSLAVPKPKPKPPVRKSRPKPPPPTSSKPKPAPTPTPAPAPAPPPPPPPPPPSVPTPSSAASASSKPDVQPTQSSSSSSSSSTSDEPPTADAEPTTTPPTPTPPPPVPTPTAATTATTATTTTTDTPADDGAEPAPSSPSPPTVARPASASHVDDEETESDVPSTTTAATAGAGSAVVPTPPPQPPSSPDSPSSLDPPLPARVPSSLSRPVPMSDSSLCLNVESGFVTATAPAATPDASDASGASDVAGNPPCSSCQTADEIRAVVGPYDKDDADVSQARSTLAKWLKTPGVVPPRGHLDATCRYPWFLHHAPVDDTSGIELVVRLSTSSASDPPVDLCVPGASILHRVLLDVTKAMDLVAEEPIPYILKVVGRHDYLTDLKTPLQRYRYAHECQRADKPMDLVLCPLTDADVALLYGPDSEVRMESGYEPAKVLNPASPPTQHRVVRSPASVSRKLSSQRLFATSLSVEIPAAPPGSAPSGPPSTTSAVSSASASSASNKTPSGVVPISKMSVPLRVRPIGIENVSSSIPSALTHFRLKFTVTLGEAQLHDATVLSSFIHPLPGRAQRVTADGPPSIAVKRGRWADPFLSLGAELCSLPASARLLVQLMAVDPVTDEGQAIGCVSLALFNEARQLRMGRWALRMFQPVSTRVDTVAHQKLGANAGQIQQRIEDTPLSILAGVPCENDASPTSPVVLFELDSYLLPIVIPKPPYRSLTKPSSARAGSGGLTPRSRTSVGRRTHSRMSASLEALRRRSSSLIASPVSETGGGGGSGGGDGGVSGGGRGAGVASPSDMSAPEIHMLSELLSRDPLSVREGFTLPERRLLWKVREDLTPISSALPKLLRCISWNRLEQRAVIYSLLPTWCELEPDHAIQMLDAGYGDELVRALAVLSLEAVPDTALMGYLQSLVQMLKYETFHDSMLARFLLLRALWNPHEVGHALFWHLKSEMHLPGVANRHGLLLEAYLQYAGPHLGALRKQVIVTEAFEAIARDAHLQPKAERTAFARRELVKQVHLLPAEFQLPLSPRMLCRGLVIESCKILSSKKTPLWMEFVNADPFGDPVVIIYKAGDDLRQDLMTLEVIKSMEELWREEGLDLPTQCYLCCCTGDEAGMIEVVLQSETTSRIQATKSGKIVGAWAKTPIIDYLREHNPDDESYSIAVDKFVRSCAAYCVATFVLGIGDRHPSNIMLTEDGYLFHIDFGHFLGNFKEKSLLGIRVRRERAPFVFTPQMAHVMGGNRSDPLFARFENLCVKAYNTLREHGHLLLDRFISMLPSALPELESQADINYLRDKLAMEIPPADAADRFKKEIDNALGTVSRQIDNMVHMSVHN